MGEVHYSAKFCRSAYGKVEQWWVDVFSRYTGNAKEMILASDPVIITWDEVELTDTIQPSQLKLRILATENGQYRDIIEYQGLIQCQLRQSNMRVVWYGVLASRTWTEPFSREKNYFVELTFSDFGYLKRIAYQSWDFFMPSTEDKGSITVGDFIEKACRKFTGSTTIPIRFYGMRMARIGAAEFKDLTVTTRNFVDGDGNGLKLYDCLEKILAAVGARIIQFAGEIRVYVPGADAYLELMLDSISILNAAGTDAELDSVELYKKVELTYNQDASDTLGQLAFDVEDTGFEGPWQYVNNGGYKAYLLCGPLYKESYKGYHANYINESNVIPCIWLVNGWMTQFKVPDGFAAPTDMPKEVVSGLAPLETENNIPINSAGTDNDNDEYPQFNEAGMVVTVSVLIDFSFIGSIHDVYLNAKIQLTPYDGSSVIFLNDSGWGETYDGSYRIHYENQGKSDWNRDWPTQWQNLKSFISLPPKSGRLKVIIYPSTLLTEYTYTGDVHTGDDSPDAYVFAISRITVEVQNAVTDPEVDSANTIVKTFDENSEDFSKSFEMGTPVLRTAGTYTEYLDLKAGQTVGRSDTYLDRYMEFVRRNYSLQVATRRRWRVRGTYEYDHSIVIPMFDQSTDPLRTLKVGCFAWFMRSEVWHVRSGRCELELEEVYVDDPEDYLLITEDGVQVVTEEEDDIIVNRKVLGL